MGRLDNLQPEAVFKHFEKICEIPRGSGNCAQISEYLADYGRQRNLFVYTDEKGNVLIRKPASPGLENMETIVLQGHMDMVCEKEAGLEFDFTKDSIEPYAVEDYVRAKGTTLGGDDGIAVAMMLAVLDDKEHSFPEIETLFTVDEETDMGGAFAFDCSVLKGHRIINLDSEYEGILMCSCAGGIDAVSSLPLISDDAEGRLISISVNGLTGGHSGVEIDKGRANSNILMGRILFSIQKESEVCIRSYFGGNRETAISQAAQADIVVPEEDTQKVTSIIEEMASVLKEEYILTDPSISVSSSEGQSGTFSAADKDSSGRIILLLMLVPDGVQAMSPGKEGLVQTSLNIGAASIDGSRFVFTNSIRSSVNSQKAMLADRVSELVKLIGGTTKLQGDYPGWAFNPDSLLKNTILQAYKTECNIKAEVDAVHAGMEAGIFADGIPDLDCVSIGPTMGEVHTPGEYLSISSVERTYKVLIKTLETAKYEKTAI